MLSELISIKIFIISFAVGIFFVYIFGPKNKIVYISPNSDNYDKYIVEDNAGNCFHYDKQVVECPKNKNDITKVKPQI